jgi:hypothetical protein
VKASSKNVCHKILWMQFAIRNVARLQSWHFNIYFQYGLD